MEKLRSIPRLLFFLITTSVVMLVVLFPPVYAQSPPEETLFVTASVDNDGPYLGQQITYVFSIFQGPELDTGFGQVRYESPAFTGFWNSQKVEQKEYTSTVDSTEYNVIELRTLLFPTVVGMVAIDPGTLTVSAGTTGESKSFRSDTVSVQVRPLPAGAISGFTGAVGRFNVSAHVDAASTRTGEPIQLKVVVSGEGNIETLPVPDWPDFDGWRVVEAPATTETQVADGRVVGSRIYGMALVPERAGDLSIPEIGYHHFDPEEAEYVEAATAPISVSVAGADGLPAEPPVRDADPPAEGRETVMRPIKPVPSSLRQREEELTASPVYWAAWAIPPLMVVGALIWRRRRASLEAARAEILRRSALPDARASLARAVASGVDLSIASADVLQSYLAARVELAVGGMTRGELLRHLSEAGADVGLTQRVEDILAAGEAARYAPSPEVSSVRGNQTERTAQLLDELEEAIGS